MSAKTIFKSFILLAFVSVVFLSCGDDTPTDPPAPSDEVKTGEITANETWSADRIYFLQGRVVVKDGVTLTIEPGTIIKGKAGDGLNASVLIIARGGKLMAQGTAANPIIFTSELDNIALGQKTGTNLDETDSNKWGGLIVLGNAKVSAEIGDTEGHIEGIPANDPNGNYGGSDDADNSGIITYVSIRHGGISIGAGNEINGLTLGGVGNGTVIDHVEIVANLDDGIECFGGTVNINHALVAYQKDDAFDIDQNFSGSFKNSMVVYNNSGDEFLEIDGPENSTNVMGMFTVENCKFISKTNDGTVDLKSKAQGIVKNNEFEGLTKFKVRTKLTNCTMVGTDAYSHYVDTPPTLFIEDNNTDAPVHVYTKSTDGSGTVCTLPSSLQPAAEAIFNNAGNTTSATPTVVSQTEFDGWSWTALNNKF